jgi:hypothetical protein
MSTIRTRWAAVGAAVAVTLGAGGIGLVDAAKEDGPRPVYTAITTCRLLDTRPLHKIGAKTDAFGPEETVTVPAWGDNGECTDIPDDVTSLQLNVTAVEATMQTHLTFWPDGDEVPNGSSLNPLPDQLVAPNAVTVDLSDTGSFNVFNFQGNVHVIIDVVGIYQDHHHDDRYATVHGGWTDGALAAGSTEGVTVSAAGTGVYCVLVPMRESLVGFQATSGTAGLIAAVDPAGEACGGVTVPDGQTAVAVFLNNGAGTATNGDFTFFAPATGVPAPASTTTTLAAP